MNGMKLFIANAGGSLSSHEPLIRQAFERAVSVVSSLLDGSDIDVVCIDDSSMVIPEIGIGGYTPSRHLTYLYINSASDNVTEQEIFNTLSHELYHAMSYDGPGYGKTLLDSMIFEGLATAFEDEVSDGDSFIVRELLGREMSQQLLQKHREELNIEEFNHFKWFIYDESNELPRWAGYEIGFYIVREYLKKTNKKASELVTEDLRLIESFADDAQSTSTY